MSISSEQSLAGFRYMSEHVKGHVGPCVASMLLAFVKWHKHGPLARLTALCVLYSHLLLIFRLS